MIYVITFTISLLFFKIATRYRKKNRKILFFVFSVLGILPPCLLAALRDLTIGTDVKVYIYPTFVNSSFFSDFSTFLEYKRTSITDILYLALTFYSQKIHPDVSVLFFNIALFTIAPIYIALLKVNKENNNAVIGGMFIYYMFFYNVTYNMARQSIALSFIVLAMAFLNDNKKLIFWILTIIAYMFHSSAAIMILVYFFFQYMKKTTDRSLKRMLIEFMVFTALIFLLAFLPNVLSAFRAFGFLSEKMSSTIDTYSGAGQFGLVNTLFYIFVYLIIYFNSEELKNKINNFEFYKYMSFLCIFILQISTIIKFSERIGFYAFYPVMFVVVPAIFPNNFNKLTKKSLNNVLIIVLVFFVYWFFWIILLQYHGTYPYAFIGG